MADQSKKRIEVFTAALQDKSYQYLIPLKKVGKETKVPTRRRLNC